MSNPVFFAACGVLLFLIGLWAVVMRPHLVRKVIALNISASGLFLLLVAMACRHYPDGAPDAVLHSMVITGLVISVSGTGLLLALIVRLKRQTGQCLLPDNNRG